MSEGKSNLPELHPARKSNSSGRGNSSGRNRSTDHLCSSCDTCRAKKTKCDGERPCEACKLSYMRKNKISSIKEYDLKRIECVYSPAKRRGPPPKHSLDREMGERERERGDQDKKQRRYSEEHPIAGLGRVPEEVTSPAAANPLSNMDAATILNLLAMLNPAASAYQWQNQQAAMPPMPPPPPPPPSIDPMSAAFLSALGNALNNQGMSMAQGLGGGATASRGYDIMSNAPSIASQQLACLQQLQQQLQQVLQQQSQLQQLQQQLQQPPTQQGQTTRGAESSMSSSVEDTKTQALQNEVARLRRRVNELETENASLKQKIDLLQMKEKARE